MAYVPNGLSLIESGLSGQSWNHWLLDTPDAVTSARVDGYISDGQSRGMKVGDLVTMRQWTTFTSQYNRAGPVLAVQLMVVASVSTSNDSVDLTDGTAVSVTDTD